MIEVEMQGGDDKLTAASLNMGYMYHCWSYALSLVYSYGYVPQESLFYSVFLKDDGLSTPELG